MFTFTVRLSSWSRFRLLTLSRVQTLVQCRPPRRMHKIWSRIHWDTGWWSPLRTTDQHTAISLAESAICKVKTVSFWKKHILLALSIPQSTVDSMCLGHKELPFTAMNESGSKSTLIIQISLAQSDRFHFYTHITETIKCLALKSFLRICSV